MTKQEKNQKMTAIVTNWLESGLMQIEFARTHDLKIATLRYWIAKRRKSQIQHPDFIQIAEPFAQGILIRYPHGVEMILPVQTPVSMIRSLLQL